MLRPGEIKSLLDRISSTVGTPAMVKLDREITPILSELSTLNPVTAYIEHPAAKQLFNWLVEPQRSGEEFYYIIGPLKCHVSTIMEEHFPQYAKRANSLGKIAAEALAVKCPVLEGYWEHAAWLVLKESFYIKAKYYGSLSDRLSAWVIHIIGDPDLCPNPNLRFELLRLLNIDYINDHNRTQIYESVLSACSSLDVDYIQAADGCEFHQMDFFHLPRTLEVLAQDGNLLKFDENLAEKLLGLKSSMLSAKVHDVAYNFAVNPEAHAQPKALYGLTALLNTTAEFAQVHHKKWVSMTLNILWDFSNINEDERNSWNSLIFGIQDTTEVLLAIIDNFGKSCQTPQLADRTASCVMDVMEVTLAAYMGSPELWNLTRSFRESFGNIDQLLGELFLKNGDIHLTNSPVGLEIIFRHKDRLSFLRNYQMYDFINVFSNIRALLSANVSDDFEL